MTESRSPLNITLSLVVVASGAVLGYYLFKPLEPSRQAEASVDESLRGVSAVAVDSQDNLYVGGSFGVKVFSPEGKLLRKWRTQRRVVALAVGSDGVAYVAYRNLVEKFSPEGKSLLRWGRGGCEGTPFGFITGLDVAERRVFVADSAERVIHQFTTMGEPLNTIGSKEKDPEGKGIILPSPCLDCAVYRQTLIVNNPGRLRVERYNFNGTLLGYWVKDDQFPGCCNPVNIAAFPDGKVATALKGEPSIKVFTKNGNLIAVFGRKSFSKTAKTIDIAVDSRGRTYAVDSPAGCVRVFSLKEGAEAKASFFPFRGWRE